VLKIEEADMKQIDDLLFKDQQARILLFFDVEKKAPTLPSTTQRVWPPQYSSPVA
jgi:hypothetical protein